MSRETGQNKTLFETKLRGANFQRPGVIHVFESLDLAISRRHQGPEMPLSDVPGPVPQLPQHFCQRELAFLESRPQKPQGPPGAGRPKRKAYRPVMMLIRDGTHTEAMA